MMRYRTQFLAVPVSVLFLLGVGVGHAAEAPHPIGYKTREDLSFVPEEFSDDTELIFQSFVTDIDGNGFDDVVCAYNNDTLYWWQNSGLLPLEFTPHLVDDNVDFHLIRLGADLSNDGRNDLVATSTPAGDLVWYENLGGSPNTFVKRTTTLSAPGFTAYVADDFDGDASTDLAALNVATGEVLWFESNGANPPLFAQHVIAGPAKRGESERGTDTDRILLSDVDEDGVVDLVIFRDTLRKLEAYINRIATTDSFELEATPPETYVSIARQAPLPNRRVFYARTNSEGNYGYSTVFRIGWNAAFPAGSRLREAQVASVKFSPCSTSSCLKDIVEFMPADFDLDGLMDYSAYHSIYTNVPPWFSCLRTDFDAVFMHGATNSNDPNTDYNQLMICDSYVSPDQNFADIDHDLDLDVVPLYSQYTDTAENTSRRPTELAFAFHGGNQQWTFAAPDIFIPSTGEWNAGAISITTSDNTNTFSFWESPIIRLGVDGTGILTDIPHASDTLYRMKGLVSTNNPDRSAAPVIRLRSSTESFEHADVLTSTSTGAGGFSPNTDGILYEHYLTLPPSQNGLRLDFDVLNANPADAANITSRLEQLELQPLKTSQLSGNRHEKSYNFGFNSNTGQYQRNGWVPRGAEPFAVMPIFEDNIEGISIRANPDAMNSFTFGFWDSAEVTNPVVLEGNRLYRLRFTVTSDEAAVRRSEVPNFRVRLNTADFRGAAYVNVESLTASSQVPVGGEFIDYDLWFFASPELNGQPLLLAFDFLHYPGLDTGRFTHVILKSLVVNSFNAPE